MAASYYFRNEVGKSFGPMTAQQLKAAAANGRLTGDMMVRRSGGDWQRASSVKNLFSAEPLAEPERPTPTPEPEEPAVEEYSPASLAERRAPGPPVVPPPIEPEELPHVVVERRTTPRERQANRTPFPVLGMVWRVYFGLAILCIVAGVGAGLVFFSIAAISGESMAILFSLLPASGAVLVGVLYAVIFLTLSEFCRLWVTLEENQRVQTDALEDIRLVLRQHFEFVQMSSP